VLFDRWGIEAIEHRDLGQPTSSGDLCATTASLAWLRPARNTFALSRAKTRDEAAPMAPPPP